MAYASVTTCAATDLLWWAALISIYRSVVHGYVTECIRTCYSLWKICCVGRAGRGYCYAADADMRLPSLTRCARDAYMRLPRLIGFKAGCNGQSSATFTEEVPCPNSSQGEQSSWCTKDSWKVCTSWAPGILLCRPISGQCVFRNWRQWWVTYSCSWTVFVEFKYCKLYMYTCVNHADTFHLFLKKAHYGHKSFLHWGAQLGLHCYPWQFEHS